MTTDEEIVGSKGYLEKELTQQFEPRELDFIFDSLTRSAADWKEWHTVEQYKVWELLKKVDAMRQGKFSPAFRNSTDPKVVCATVREAGY